MRGTVAPELVGDQPAWLAPLPFQQLTEEALGCVPVPTRLDEDIDHVSVFVDGPPEVVPPAPDRDEELVQGHCQLEQE